MNGIIGMTGLLLDTELLKPQRNYAEATLQSAEALLTLINDILDFSKIEAGKMKLKTIAFDLQLLAENVVELMSIICREKKTTLLLRYQPGMPRHLIGDPGQIRQVLLNLLSNAMKFTDSGYVLVTFEELKPSIDSDNLAKIAVSVKDTGIGILENKQKTIFDQLDQTIDATSREYGRTGLGLSISRQLSELMRGHISVESQVNVGSTFTFTMSLARNPSESDQILDSNKLANFQGQKTLIIDVLDISQTLLAEQLEALNVRIDFAKTPQAAIEKLKLAFASSNPYDIIFTDSSTLEFDGDLFLHDEFKMVLKSQCINIFVSMFRSEVQEKEIEAIGFDGYLTKSIHLSEIFDVLCFILKQKKMKPVFPS